jgi:MFS family permease
MSSRPGNDAATGRLERQTGAVNEAAQVPARPSLGLNYRKLWASSALANLADGIFAVALPVMAVSLTTSPALVAGVAIAGRLPWLVFVLIAGALADRLDRRVTMRNVQLLRVAVLGAMVGLALIGQLSLPVLYVAAFVLGVGETLFDTAAQSIMPNIVSRDLLSVANGRLYAIEMVMNQFVGPPLGGFVVAMSVPLALAGSALGYALAAIGLALLVGSFRPLSDGPRPSMLADIREGLGFLFRNRVLRTLAVMVAIDNLVTSAVFAVLVLYVLAPGPMGLDAFGYGVLMTGFAVGAIVGTVLEPGTERRLGRSNVLFLTVLATSAAVLVPALTANPVAVFAALVVAGVVVMMWNIITVSLRQRITPDRLLGRVNAGYRLFAWGSMPIGALLGGLIGELFGVVAVFVVAGLANLSLLVFRVILTDATIDAAELPQASPKATDA